MQNTQEKTMEDVNYLSEWFNTSDLTTIYNAVLDRDVKKVSQKSIAVEALAEHMTKKNKSLQDYVGALPADIVNVLVANDAVEAPAKGVSKTKSEQLVQNDIDPDGAFVFGTKIGCGEYMRKLIIGNPDGDDDAVVDGLLDPVVILEKVAARFPKSVATAADVAYNKTRVREMGYSVPIFRSTKS